MVKSVTQTLLKALSSRYICKLISIVLALILFAVVSSIGESGYAFADAFGCYDKICSPNNALINSEKCIKPRDYRITNIDNKSDVTVLSIHGGIIEPNTTTISAALSARNNWNRYDFYGEIKAEKCSRLAEVGKENIHNNVLHITSANFDEPKAVALVESHKKAVSIHGYSRTENADEIQTICVGGANQIQVLKFIKYIKNKKDETKKIKDLLGYSLNPINVPNPGDTPEQEKKICFEPRVLAGIDKMNIVNRANNGMNDNNDNQGGLQIELNRKIRIDLANGKDEHDSSFPDGYQRLRNVVYDAINCAMSDKNCLD